MKLKVCGMKYKSNIQELLNAGTDYMGFIFYDKSKRFVSTYLDEKLLNSFKSEIIKVGVFVNQSLEEIIIAAEKYKLSAIQLHGDETPELSKKVKDKGYVVIKAFSLDENFNFNVLEPYKAYCQYFLFDTKGEGYGGTGKKFDWNILK